MAGAVIFAGLMVALQANLGGLGNGHATTTVAVAARPVVARVWVVRPGDTLWGIVEATGVKGDPRPMVDRLVAQLQGRPLQPGQRLAVR